MDLKHMECYLNIIKIITQKNPAVLSEMKQCLNYTKGFYKIHRERYEYRDMVWEDYLEDENRFLWISLVDILAFHGYLFEIGWKDLLEDILPELKNTAIKKKYTFEVLSFLEHLLKQKKPALMDAHIDFSLIPPNPNEKLLQEIIDDIHHILETASKGGDLTGEILHELTVYLKSLHKSLVCLDIGSDCYDLTLIDSHEYDSLLKAADALGQNIFCSYSF